MYVDLNRRGIVTGPSTKAPEDARWHRRTLKRVPTEPATIGCVRLPSGEQCEVAVPLISREDWDRLDEWLYDPAYGEARKPDWSTRRKYVLSGLLRCSASGHYLSGSLRNRTEPDGAKITAKSWVCATATGGCGKIRIDNHLAERFVVRSRWPSSTLRQSKGPVVTAWRGHEHRPAPPDRGGREASRPARPHVEVRDGRNLPRQHGLDTDAPEDGD